MKKPLLFTINILIISQLSFSQSTTILPNRLSVPNISANGTCDNTSKGSTVFNTTDNKMYFCNGTNWQEMTGGGFTLPYSATQNVGSPLLYLKNTAPSGKAISVESTDGIGVYGLTTDGIGVWGTSSTLYGTIGYSISGRGVYGNCTSGEGVYGLSTSGHGVFGSSTSGNGVYGSSTSGSGVYGLSTNNNSYGGYFKSVSGTALGVSGQIEINNTTGSKGAVLSINSANKPTWQDPVAFSVNNLGVNNFSIVSNVDTKLPFTYEEFDLGNDFSIVNSDFTAPIKGVYHFDASVLWNAHTNGVGIVAITLIINSSVHSSVRLPAATGKEISNMLSLDVLLNANDKVYVVAYQTSGVAQIISQNGIFSRFNGSLVYSL